MTALLEARHMEAIAAKAHFEKTRAAYTDALLAQAPHKPGDVIRWRQRLYDVQSVFVYDADRVPKPDSVLYGYRCVGRENGAKMLVPGTALVEGVA